MSSSHDFDFSSQDVRRIESAVRCLKELGCHVEEADEVEDAEEGRTSFFNEDTQAWETCEDDVPITVLTVMTPTGEGFVVQIPPSGYDFDLIEGDPPRWDSEADLRDLIIAESAGEIDKEDWEAARCSLLCEKVVEMALEDGEDGLLRGLNWLERNGLTPADVEKQAADRGFPTIMQRWVDELVNEESIDVEPAFFEYAHEAGLQYSEEADRAVTCEILARMARNEGAKGLERGLESIREAGGDPAEIEADAVAMGRPTIMERWVETWDAASGLESADENCIAIAHKAGLRFWPPSQDGRVSVFHAALSDASAADRALPLAIAATPKEGLESGRNPASDSHDVLPLAELVSQNRVGCIGLMIARGVEVDARGPDGETALHCARSAEAVRALRGNGADIEAVDKNGQTPLHYMVFFNQSAEGADELVQSGANLTARDKDGMTPLALAKRIVDQSHTNLINDPGLSRKEAVHGILERAELNRTLDSRAAPAREPAATQREAAGERPTQAAPSQEAAPVERARTRARL